MSSQPTTLELIEKTQEYLDYVKEHVLNVKKAWTELQVKCSDMRFMWDDFYYFSITDAVECHDISKLSEQEFVQYRKAFYPAVSEPEFDMAEAWEHHKKENDHHWENWAAVQWGDNPTWEIPCVHMVIDWMAMGYKFGDTAQSYYEANKEKIGIPSCAEKFIYQIFERLTK
jgi:hypothetical protein